MTETIFTYLLRSLTERKQALQESLAGGGAQSYDEYCRMVGEYSALQRLEDDVKDLEKRFIAD